MAAGTASFDTQGKGSRRAHGHRSLDAHELAHRKRGRRELRTALFFISPWIIGFLVFTAWPIGYSAYLSLTDYDFFSNPEFIGTQNYQDLLDDRKFVLSLRNTVFYTVIQVPLYVLVSLSLAMLLNKAVRWSGFFRTAFYLPNMTPPVAVGILLLLVFNGQNGLVNEVLGWFGVQGPAWTTDPDWVKPAIILMSLWSVGGSVIILLAALRNVPQELYDAARVDGANAWQRTVRITLPMISPALFFVTVINTINAFQTFTETYTAFFGAGNSTYSNDAALFYNIYLFQQAFEFFEMGYAAAMAWVLFVIIMIVTLIQVRVSRRLVYLEGRQ